MNNTDRVFNNEVYEQQRKNIEALAKKYPDDWFYEQQMSLPPKYRTGFAPYNRKCFRCGKDITEGENGITLKKLGDGIITSCPHCNRSFCD